MYKIAIIEDSYDFAHALSWLLEGSMDCDVRIFKEVSQFEGDFDIILADLRLKETYGSETIKAIREKTHAPIIVLTGLGGPYLSASDMQMFLEAGANEVFNKEVVTDALFPEKIIKVINES